MIFFFNLEWLFNQVYKKKEKNIGVLLKNEYEYNLANTREKEYKKYWLQNIWWYTRKVWDF